MPPPQRSGNVDLITLVITAIASAVAAYVTSQLWADGTLIAAALTPVIVALVKEALARPVDKMQTVRVQRQTGDVARVEEPGAEPPVTVYGGTGRRWRLAVITGLAAFAIVVTLFTVPELLAGESIGRGGDRATTFFGGKERRPDRPRKRRTRPGGAGSEAEPAGDQTATPTPTPTATPSPSPTATATESPAPTATPSPTETPTPADP